MASRDSAQLQKLRVSMCFRFLNGEPNKKSYQDWKWKFQPEEEKGKKRKRNCGKRRNCYEGRRQRLRYAISCFLGCVNGSLIDPLSFDPLWEFAIDSPWPSQEHM